MVVLSSRSLRKFSPIKAPVTGLFLTMSKSMRELMKAVVPTPRGPDGKVDWEEVGPYSSIWVTVTDESSPLHGRPILLTKLPDGRFAVTGGAGFSQWGEKGKAAFRARKHLAITTGKVHGTAADIAKEEERKQVVAHNEPLKRRLDELRKLARSERKKAQRKFEEATGCGEKVGKAKLKEMREQIASHAEEELGMGKKESRTFASEVTRQLRKGAGNLRALAAARRARAAMEVHRFEGEEYEVREGLMGLEARKDELKRELTGNISLTWDWSAVAQEVAQTLETASEEGREVSPTEIQSLVAKAGEEVYVHALEQFIEHGVDTSRWEEVAGLTTDTDWEGKEEETSIPEVLGREPEPEEEVPPPETAMAVQIMEGLDVEDADAMTEAVESFKALHEAQVVTRSIRKELLPEDIERVTPQALEQFREEIEAPSETEVEALIRAYEESVATSAAPDKFYTALSVHWSNHVSYAEGVGQYAVKGAATAVAGLVGQYMGQRMDVMRLMEKVGIEGAVWALALELRKKYAGRQSELVKVLRGVERQAAEGQEATEQAALKLNAELGRQEKIVRQQVAAGELSGVRGREMEADVLMRQRENLGTAYGSLQATAAFAQALEKALRPGATDEVVINFGEDQEGAQVRFKELRLGRRGKLHYSEKAGWQIVTTARGMRKFMYSQEQDQRRNGEWEEIKGDQSSTDGYEVPMWGTTFIDAEGQEQEHSWRTEQRNDIEWLRKAGSGVITRVTGAGKTNTCLGYYAHMMQEDPDFIGHIVVPKGRVEQWASECRKFAPELAGKMVAIDESWKVSEIQDALARVGAGAFVVISHRDASRHSEYLDVLEPHAITVDEPQELFSQTAKSPKLSAGAKRIMRIQTDHRVALTATPAVRAPTDVYDLVHWAFPKALGYRTRFARAYGGFGYGTNAQDEAVQNVLWNEISPFLSGDRLSPPSFDVHSETVEVQRTPWQRRQLIEMEAGAEEWIEKRKKQLVDGASARDRAQYGSHWRSVLGRRYKKKATEEFEHRQRDVLRGGRDFAHEERTAKKQYRYAETARVQSMLKKVGKAGEDKRHVIFVDSTAQRASIAQALYDSGVPRTSVKNIASGVTGIGAGDIERRKREFTEGDARFILIDRTSSSGHNLQRGDFLHVLGTPESAATYLQAQGRVAREPRKGNVGIVTYRHEDSPYDFSDWATLDTQTKILRATAPGLFADPKMLQSGRQLERSMLFLELTGPAKTLSKSTRGVWNWDDCRTVARLTLEEARCLV